VNVITQTNMFHDLPAVGSGTCWMTIVRRQGVSFLYRTTSVYRKNTILHQIHSKLESQSIGDRRQANAARRTRRMCSR